jgi:hypothetical protein
MAQHSVIQMFDQVIQFETQTDYFRVFKDFQFRTPEQQTWLLLMGFLDDIQM